MLDDNEPIEVLTDLICVIKLYDNKADSAASLSHCGLSQLPRYAVLAREIPEKSEYILITVTVTHKSTALNI